MLTSTVDHCRGFRAAIRSGQKHRSAFPDGFRPETGERTPGYVEQQQLVANNGNWWQTTATIETFRRLPATSGPNTDSGSARFQAETK